MNSHQRINVDCPYCHTSASTPWATERGYHVVRCDGCGFLYVNPAPAAGMVHSAVRTGVHRDESGDLDVRARRIDRKVAIYRRLLRSLLADVWQREKPVHWLDVGSGYGELLEAIGDLACAGSVVEGIEPMTAKAEAARARGLTVADGFLNSDRAAVDFVSSIDVFSHVPDYRVFLQDMASVLKPGGEIIMETGNLADVQNRRQFPNELGLPDHLTFAGRKHIVGYLEEAGFEIVAIREIRFDTLVNVAKTVVKMLLGRPVVVGIPYTSAYRQLVVRARLVARA